MWNPAAGGFSLNNGTAHSSAASRQLGTSIAFVPVGNSRKTIRPIDANKLIYVLVDMEGKGLDDATISECINAVRKAPTIKRHFGKWMKKGEK